MFIFINKRMDKIFFYGACELLDACNRLKKIAPTREHEYTQGTQMSSIYSKDGRIRDTVRKWWNKHIGDNNRVYSGMYKKIREEFVDNQALTEFQPASNDWLTINFSLEINPTFAKDKEYIFVGSDLNRAMKHAVKNKKFPMHIYELLNDKNYYIPFNDEWKLHTLKHEWRERHIETIESKFKNRVIVFLAEAVTKYRNDKVGVYQELPDLKKSVAVYQTSRSNQFSGVQSHYNSKKVLRYITTGFRLSYPYKTQYVHAKSENLIGDDHHHRGKHSHHYDQKSIDYIARMIDQKITTADTSNEHKRMSIQERLGKKIIED